MRIDGADLRRAREALGLTVREFAKLVGLSLGFVSRLENGRRPVTAAIALHLRTSAGVNVSV